MNAHINLHLSHHSHSAASFSRRFPSGLGGGNPVSFPRRREVG